MALSLIEHGCMGIIRNGNMNLWQQKSGNMKMKFVDGMGYLILWQIDRPILTHMYRNILHMIVVLSHFHPFDCGIYMCIYPHNSFLILPVLHLHTTHLRPHVSRSRVLRSSFRPKGFGQLGFAIRTLHGVGT